jgi:wyosine [tRNA(Phe)-imidazoG37] synthetase (radical SAM superfamily)
MSPSVRSTGAVDAPPFHPRLRRSRPPGAVVYGPLESRRLGRSLGINLTPPGCRACNFECVYCEVPRRPWGEPDGLWWPTPAHLVEALELALPRCGRLDSITLSGAGEPTLHPRFDAAVAAVLGQARRARLGVPVRILTNGTGAVRPEVRAALDRLDERIVTLDANPEAINRPHPRAPLGGVVQALALLRDVTLQSCFVGGEVSNAGGAAVREWIELVAALRPARVQIYTISRKPAAHDVWPLPLERLEAIGARLRARTGIRARVFA